MVEHPPEVEKSPGVASVDGHFTAALAAFERGRWDEVAGLCDRVLAALPGHVGALHLGGLARLNEGDAAAAVSLLGRAVAIDEASAALHNNLGAALRAAGRREAAIAAFARAAEIEPDHPDAHANRGALLREAGRLDEAEAALGRALALAPDHPAALNNMAGVHLARGRAGDAERALRRVLALAPDTPEALATLALLEIDRGRAAEAEALLVRALAARPGFAEARNNLGTALLARDRCAEAAEAFARAIADGADGADVHANLGDALRGAGRPADALAALDAALARAPGHARAWYLKGEALRDLDRLDDAVAAWERCLELAPDFAEAHFSLGSTAMATCDPAEAVRRFRAAQALIPDSPRVHDNLLMFLHYAPDVGRDELFEEHRRWAARHASTGVPRPPLRDPDPERPLRVGFVSSGFRFYAVAFFFLDVLRVWPREAWHVTLYSMVRRPDPYTAAFRTTADAWRDVVGLDDDALVERVRADAIDILIDLNGHTKDNRLPAFARRPAPVQAAWLDCIDTTGMEAIDFFIADRHQAPSEDDRYYVEEVIRLPHDHVCYAPPAYAEAVRAPPCLKRGHVTFGCFNTAYKITPETIAAWGRVLTRVPTARLVLSSPEFAATRARERYLDRLAAAGVAAERVEIRPGAQHREFLAAYHGVDIALDPFPYSGGLTTCEALWMGVPVVTFAGGRFCSRHAASHLHTIGHVELVGADVDGYVEIAVALAHDPARLTTLRARLRADMGASPLTDTRRFAGELAALLRGLWRRACRGGLRP